MTNGGANTPPFFYVKGGGAYNRVMTSLRAH